METKENKKAEPVREIRLECKINVRSRDLGNLPDLSICEPYLTELAEAGLSDLSTIINNSIGKEILGNKDAPVVRMKERLIFIGPRSIDIEDSENGTSLVILCDFRLSSIEAERSVMAVSKSAEGRIKGIERAIRNLTFTLERAGFEIDKSAITIFGTEDGVPSRLCPDSLLFHDRMIPQSSTLNAMLMDSFVISTK